MMHDGKKRKNIMPSRKRLLYPKRKISRKIRGGDAMKMVSKIGSTLIFTKFGLSAAVALTCPACAASAGALYYVAAIPMSLLFNYLNTLVHDELLGDISSDTVLGKIFSIIYKILPTSIFAYFMYTMNYDVAAITGAAITGAEGSGVTQVPLGVNGFKSATDALISKITTFKLGAALTSIAEAAGKNATAAIPTAETGDIQLLFAPFKILFWKLVGFATGTWTGNVLTVAAVGFIAYYIKTRLTANKEENEKLNKQLSEHERRRLLIYRYQQRVKDYEKIEEETDELEQKEEEEIQLETHFSDKVVEKRQMKEEKASEKRQKEEEKEIVLKKPRTPAKKPRTPVKKPPTPVKNYRPEFGENKTEQYKISETTPK
jgi:hypothetical protein